MFPRFLSFHTFPEVINLPVISTVSVGIFSLLQQGSDLSQMLFFLWYDAVYKKEEELDIINFV
jgi:hypothetical protein